MKPENMKSVIFANCSQRAILNHHQGEPELINGIMVVLKNTAEREEMIKNTVMLTVRKKGSTFFTDEKGDVHKDWIVSEETQSNFNAYIAELKMLRDEIGFDYKLNYLPIPHDETAETHFDVFRMLVQELKPKQNDEVEKFYADVTFGMKPISMILFMVFNYLYRFTNNALPDVMIYNQYDPVLETKKLFELSHLFHMNAMFEHMTGLNVKDPLEYVERLLGMQEEGMPHETRPES